MKGYKKCKVCSNLFERDPYKPFKNWCTPECGYELILANLKKQADNKWKKEKAVLKEKVKKLADYEKEAKTEFQKWIRKRDAGMPCISCGTVYAKKWDASHYFKAEIYSGLVFDERNVHKSCVFCNQHLHGNLIEYRIGLVKRYGIGYVENLENDSVILRNMKFSKDELIDIKNKYRNLNK